MYRLIIAEDDKWCREGLKNIDWQTHGIELVGAFKDGQEALNCHEKNPADIVLTDIRMPNIDGITLLKRTKEISENTAVILVSAHEDFHYAREAIDFGALAYITKPFSKKQIIEAVLKGAEKADQSTKDSSLNKEAVISGVLKGEKNVITSFEDLLKQKDKDEKYKGFQIIATKIPVDKMGKEELISFVDDCFCIVEHNIIYAVDIICEKMSRYALRGKIHELCKNSGYEGMKIGVGKEVKRLEDIHESYKTANDLLDYMFFHHETTVLMYKDVEEIISSPKKNRYIQIADVINYVKKGKTILLRDIFDRMRLACRGDHIDKDIVIMQFGNILRQVDDLLKSKGVFENVDHNIMLTFFNNYDEMNEYTYSYCLHATTYFKALANYSPMVKKALDYIVSNYADDELSLKKVAVSIDSSYNSLSRDFHHQVGTAFNTYLNKYRIDKAKKLLVETDMPIAQICNAIGLQQKNFNRLFSKYEEITPTEYRKQDR